LAYATPIPSPTLMVRQHTEEPAQDPAVLWSPDSRRLVTYRIDTRGAGTLSMVQHAPPDRVRPYHYTYFYPLPEDSVLPTADLFVFEIGSWRRIPVEIPPIALQYYGGPSRGRWLDDGRRLSLVVTDRGYTRRQFLEIDATTGAARTIVDERGEPYVDVYAGTLLEALDGGREWLWGSERDGWMHLYLYDGATGSVQRQLTSGAWVVSEVSRVDEKRRAVYFMARGREPGRDPYLQHLYRVSLDGGAVRLLTPESADHAVSFSPTGTSFVDTYSRPDLPPVSVLRRTTDGAVTLELERADLSRLLATGWRRPEPFAAKARDGTTDVYGLIWWPSTFDSTRTYPVIEQIYTGPHGFFVPKTFAAYRNTAQSIAELGFIVVQVDGLGTAGRGRAFHLYSYRNLGDGGIDDHIAALRQMAAAHPAMDLSRVGIYGHSAGGYDAAHAMLTHPEFYTVGVSSAGNHDHRMDKAVWNTQWMGWPVGENYREQSNVTLADRLQGKLLLVHGDVDENVPVSATLQFVNALIAANKDFDMLILPNRPHGFGRDPYFTRKRWDYFVGNLLGVEPPAYRISAPPSRGPRP
jgi:dipeptidyl-peptidase-4